METRAGIRELRARFSAYLQRVREGETVVITDHGKPVGRIVPYRESVEARIEVLREMGLAEWDGRSLSALAPVARARGDRTVAEVLLEDRQ